MSSRHRHGESIAANHDVVRAEVQAERKRVHTQLVNVRKAVDFGVDPDDVDAPDVERRPRHHRHDADVAREKAAEPRWKRQRHWKTKAWKRRKVWRAAKVRRARALRDEV